MTHAEKFALFKDLHRAGKPLVLYNIWDAGGAVAMAQAGARAIATGSWSMAAAHGYPDGEAIPLDLVLRIVERITRSVDQPVTVDFEGGYAVDPNALATNAGRLIQAGAIGINFEDRVVNGSGLYSIEVQSARLAALKSAAERQQAPLFVNARTDLFLGTSPDTHVGAIDEAIDRAAAYAQAGADGFFIPGLSQADLIAQIVDRVNLPVNVMMGGALNMVAEVARLGVSRASFGPAPYVSAMADLKARFEDIK